MGKLFELQAMVLWEMARYDMFFAHMLVAVLSSHNVLIYEQLISQQNSSGPQKAW